jgi:hypothetical protein
MVMIAAPPPEMMFPPYPDDLFWRLIDKLEKALKFQGRLPSIVFWERVRANESRQWCQRALLLYFLDTPVPDFVLAALVNDENGQFAANDPRRLELALDAVYQRLREYEDFVHIGP